METKFKICWQRLAGLPSAFGMRSASVQALLRAGFSILQNDIDPRFKAARAADRFDIQHNGQVCYLRAALNTQFKSASGIYFDIAETVPNLAWIYAKTEETPNGHIYAKTEDTTDTEEAKGIIDPLLAPNEAILDVKNTFIIYVPADLYATQLMAIKRFVNKYRLITRVPQYEPKYS